MILEIDPTDNTWFKKKYGILNNPRQSLFVNNIEAMKQTIERINGVLIKNLIVENKNLTGLNYKEDS